MNYPVPPAVIPLTLAIFRAMPRSKKVAVGRGVAVPAARRTAARQIARILKPGMKVALLTHVNADGDGSGR